jgi:hypothetical protein
LREIWGQERPLEVEVDVRASKVLAAEFEVVDASIYRTETNGPVPRKQQPYYTDPVPAGLAAQFFLRGLEPADYDLALFLRARHSDVDPEKWAAQIEKDRNGWLVIIAHVYRL